MFEMIKQYYERGLWDIQKVRNAVTRGAITTEQFKEITGEEA